MRTVEDLDGDDPASIGGAMGQWPRRTPAWACRDRRVEMADPEVIGMLMSREAEALRDLADAADRLGIGTANLRSKAAAIEAAAAEDLLEVVEEEYRDEHGDGLDGCPFEDSGFDKACWRCPVPSRAVERLRGERDRPTPRGAGGR